MAATSLRFTQMKKPNLQVGPERARARTQASDCSPWGSPMGPGLRIHSGKGGSREEALEEGHCLLQGGAPAFRKGPPEPSWAIQEGPARLPRVLGPAASISSISMERASQTQDSFSLDSRPRPPWLPGCRENTQTGWDRAGKEPICSLFPPCFSWPQPLPVSWTHVGLA